MARVRSGRWAVALAVLVLSAVALAGGALGATAEECTPLKKRACKKSPYCRFGGKGVGCAVASDPCNAVQGKKMRKKCAAVTTMRCECSKSRKKCGTCKESLVTTAPDPNGCAATGSCVCLQADSSGNLQCCSGPESDCQVKTITGQYACQPCGNAGTGFSWMTKADGTKEKVACNTCQAAGAPAPPPPPPTPPTPWPSGWKSLFYYNTMQVCGSSYDLSGVDVAVMFPGMSSCSTTPPKEVKEGCWYTVGSGEDPISPATLSTATLTETRRLGCDGVMIDFEGVTGFTVGPDGSQTDGIVQAFSTFLNDAGGSSPLEISITTGGSGFTAQLCCSLSNIPLSGGTCDPEKYGGYAKCAERLGKIFDLKWDGVAQVSWAPQMYDVGMNPTANFDFADDLWGAWNADIYPSVASPHAGGGKVDPADCLTRYNGGSPGKTWIDQNGKTSQVKGLACFPWAHSK